MYIYIVYIYSSEQAAAHLGALRRHVLRGLQGLPREFQVGVDDHLADVGHKTPCGDLITLYIINVISKRSNI